MSDAENRPTRTFFRSTEEGTRRALFPGVTITTNAGDAMMFSRVEFEPGSVVPVHSHPHEQMGVMISGRLEFNVGGEVRVLGPGELWVIPGGVVHSVRAHDGPAVALDVFHPIREDYR